MRKIKVDMDALELAFDDRSVETSYYLDLETGEVVAVTEEISLELEAIYDGMPEEADEESFEEALRDRGLPDWTKDELREADRVETGNGERFISVPKTESSEAYGDMDDFIATVKDNRLQGWLEGAIDSRGAFRWRKDVVARLPGEQERQFRFQTDRLRERILESLEEEGIAAVERLDRM
jgi:hypothetical protein